MGTLGRHWKLSKEIRLKFSKNAKKYGIGKWNKGKKRSEEIKRKISLSNKGKKPYIMTQEIRNRMRLSQLGKKIPEEVRIKISNSLKKIGHKPPINIGEKNYLWRGGISFEPYSVDWTKTLKRSIRERDRYSCKICGEKQEDRSFDIHHIDYNKKNCDPNNLITLCHSCHTKTNSKRDYWINYFKKQLDLAENVYDQLAKTIRENISLRKRTSYWICNPLSRSKRLYLLPLRSPSQRRYA